MSLAVSRWYLKVIDLLWRKTNYIEMDFRNYRSATQIILKRRPLTIFLFFHFVHIVTLEHFTLAHKKIHISWYFHKKFIQFQYLRINKAPFMNPLDSDTYHTERECSISIKKKKKRSRKCIQNALISTRFDICQHNQNDICCCCSPQIIMCDHEFLSRKDRCNEEK